MNQQTIGNPHLDGRIIVVTGTGGLGFETARTLAAAGACLVLAGRNPEAGEDAVRRICYEVPAATIAFHLLDLASLESIAKFADGFEGKVDALICNAGVMSPPDRRVTEDGLELQFGVNYLGHFALVARLLPNLRMSDDPRVISVTSLAHRYGRLDFADLQNERNYRAGVAYCHSKLAQAMFARELQRRSDAAGWGITSLAVHPGFARTNLFDAHGRRGALQRLAIGAASRVFGQSAAEGAQPLVHAATAPDVRGGQLYGPTGLFEMRGPPGRRRFASAALDAEAGSRLWDVSVELAMVRFTDTAS